MAPEYHRGMTPTIPPAPRPKLLLTRPRPASERFAAELRDDGAGPFDYVISPLVGIVPDTYDVGSPCLILPNT